MNLRLILYHLEISIRVEIFRFVKVKAFWRKRLIPSVFTNFDLVHDIEGHVEKSRPESTLEVVTYGSG